MEETIKSIRLFGTEVIPRIAGIGVHTPSEKQNVAAAAD
jgi:hypothetical protein